jgi:hypothetical protein
MWRGFGEALAAVAGALTGLLFVALSVKANVLAGPGAARFIERFSPNAITAVLVGVAGLTFLLKAGGGLYWLIPAAMASLLGGVVNAWIFLVKVTSQWLHRRRERQPGRRRPVEFLPDQGCLLETLRAGNLGQCCPRHDKVIVCETRHDVHMKVEERVIGCGVVLEHDRSLGAVQGWHGRGQVRGDREDLIPNRRRSVGQVSDVRRRQHKRMPVVSRMLAQGGDDEHLRGAQSHQVSVYLTGCNAAERALIHR